MKTSSSLPPIISAPSSRGMGILEQQRLTLGDETLNEGFEDDEEDRSDDDYSNFSNEYGNSTNIGNSSSGIETTKSPVESLPSHLKKQQKKNQKGNLPDKGKVYGIDYVGTGTFQSTQHYLLNKRSLEPLKSNDAMLSARGLHHRSKDYFIKEAHNASHIISNMMSGEKVTSSKYKPSPQLFQPHFQRALANERLNKLSKAIEDYTTCIRINPSSSQSYFNRSNLYKLRKKYTEAINDMNMAIKIEPANIEYRMARSLLFRENGDYHEAVKDTILTRALQREPTIARTLESAGGINGGSEPKIVLESDLAYAMKLEEDPIILALAIPSAQRTKQDIEPIIDFLSSLKFFSSFQNNYDILSQIAKKVELSTFSKGKYIFQEGDIGNHFYIIFDGEVSIVKVKKSVFDEIIDTTVLVKMFRGQTFGETALESKGGLRTAGAIATQKAKLLALAAEDYLMILSRFRTLIKEEVRTILTSSALFADWEQSKLDYLASFAIIKNYSANSEIMKSNEPVPSLMLIKSGIVQLIKSIPKPDLSSIMKKTSNNTVVINEDFNEIPGLPSVSFIWFSFLTIFVRFSPCVRFMDFE
jgi:CRP-like cAMP-binding protein